MTSSCVGPKQKSRSWRSLIFSIWGPNKSQRPVSCQSSAGCTAGISSSTAPARFISSRTMASTLRSTSNPSGIHVYRPLPSFLISPARNMSLWLTSSASLGASLRVEIKNCDVRMLLLVVEKRLFYRPVHWNQRRGQLARKVENQSQRQARCYRGGERERRHSVPASGQRYGAKLDEAGRSLRAGVVLYPGDDGISIVPTSAGTRGHDWTWRRFNDEVCPPASQDHANYRHRT